MEHGQVQVGIQGGIPMSGKMLQATQDTPVCKATYHLARLPQDGIRVVAEGAKPDHRIVRIRIGINNGGKIPVDPRIPAVPGDGEANLINKLLLAFLQGPQGARIRILWGLLHPHGEPPFCIYGD